MGVGSGSNGAFTFLDSISIASFLIGVMNLEENLTQGDKQDLENKLSSSMELLLNEIHSHLNAQDKKIDTILKYMEDMRYDR